MVASQETLVEPDIPRHEPAALTREIVFDRDKAVPQLPGDVNSLDLLKDGSADRSNSKATLLAAQELDKLGFSDKKDTVFAGFLASARSADTVDTRGTSDKTLADSKSQEKLTIEQIALAWENPEFNESLTAAQKAMLPPNPAGEFLYSRSLANTDMFAASNNDGCSTNRCSTAACTAGGGCGGTDNDGCSTNRCSTNACTAMYCLAE